jgi:hypothetical protein
MTAAEAREKIGVFGELYANGDNYPKWLHGKITDVDRMWTEFTDNNGFIHLFRTARIIYFKPKRFVNNFPAKTA